MAMEDHGLPIDAEALAEEEEVAAADGDAEAVGGDALEEVGGADADGGAGHEGGGGGDGVGGGGEAAGCDLGGGAAAGGEEAAPGVVIPVVVGGEAMWAAGMAIGDVSGDRLAALKQREAALVVERRQLARDAKNVDRKRRRLIEKTRGLSFDDLQLICGQMVAAKVKAAAKPKPKPKAKGTAKAKAKAAADE